MKILECVPNFSEGRDEKKIAEILSLFKNRGGIRLLNSSFDKDHNRMVATIAGEPREIINAMLEATARAIKLIDLNRHTGAHPRIGAVDVIPFIPLGDMTMEEAKAFALEFGEKAAEKYNLPVFLYENSASHEYRRALENIRKGGFEGLGEKLKDPKWQPDFGPNTPHLTAGAAVTGARMPLIAFNVNLNSRDLNIAKAIAKRVRHSGGGLRCLKAMGVELKEKGLVQVSMNITDYTQTSVYQAVEMVRMEAMRYGITLAGSELIGLMPLGAVIDSAAYYLGLEDFTPARILEINI